MTAALFSLVAGVRVHHLMYRHNVGPSSLACFEAFPAVSLESLLTVPEELPDSVPGNRGTRMDSAALHALRKR